MLDAVESVICGFKTVRGTGFVILESDPMLLTMVWTAAPELTWKPRWLLMTSTFCPETVSPALDIRWWIRGTRVR